MAKNKPGLPDGFALNLDAPSQLGDYLDEDFSDNTARVIAARRALQPAAIRPEKPALPPVVPPTPTTPTALPVQTIAIRSDSVLDLNEARKRVTPKVAPFRRPPRKQFNMSPDTVARFMEIVDHVQLYSLQDDVKASEIFDAVVNILHDAKQEMTFNDVPRRGKWGTPTAKAFPTSLGNAFARSIALRYTKLRSE